MRISELADRVGEHAVEVDVVARARSMGLSCDQITDLLPIWDGSNCGAAQERVGQLIEEKRTEIAERVEELRRFAAQLDKVKAEIEASPQGSACRTDLSCCVPEAWTERVSIELSRGAPRDRPVPRSGSNESPTHGVLPDGRAVSFQPVAWFSE